MARKNAAQAASDQIKDQVFSELQALIEESEKLLNDSAALIGGLIDGQRDVAAIISELDKQFPGVPELGDDIEQFMEVARAQHWIELA